MAVFALTILASLVALVAGQNANGTAAAGTLGIQAIQANFAQAGLSGSGNLLPTFEPSALMSVSYPVVGAINPGQNLTYEQVNSAPTIALTPANASVSLTGNYTLMMVDADIVGAPADNNTRHWLVNGANLSSGTLSNASATAPEPYAGPLPAAGSGSHRYVLLLLEQPSNFSSPAGLAPGIVKINLAQYIQESGLGAVVAATYIQVQNGVSTVSVSATSAVVTSTLAAAKSSASGGSASGSGSGAGASPTSKTSGAARLSAASGLVLALVGALAML